MLNFGSKSRFVVLVLIQFVCAKTILWSGLPIYRKLLDGKKDEATPREILAVIAAVLVMQAAYWSAHRLQTEQKFRQNAILGKFFQLLAEVSFLFPATLVATVLFDEDIDLKTDWWRMLVLAASLFAMYCYKQQLDFIGTAMAGKQSDS
ncbi:MAG: hypothetical protein JNL58_26675 [Planctomyces sp.]|nr:hypothetical protein [Planctomyces sp.]